MRQLILEFPFTSGSAKIEEGRIIADLGNGVRLVADVPSWVERVEVTTLQLVMNVEGNPPDADPN